MPIGHELPDGALCGRPLQGCGHWQIISTRGAGRALLVTESLHDKWLEVGLIEAGDFAWFSFGKKTYYEVSCGPSRRIDWMSQTSAPSDGGEAFAFASALYHTRLADPASPLQDAVYVETLSRLLPTYETSEVVTDDVLLGSWLTGGAHVSARSIQGLQRMIPWIPATKLRDLVHAAGIDVDEYISTDHHRDTVPMGDDEKAFGTRSLDRKSSSAFRLFGRAGLESFFHEHVIDIVRNEGRYKALGIDFPSPTILYGPPGCGKTYAVERLIEHLGWPAFHVEASTVASPYIHETSRKVSEIFELAVKSAPSVLVIDEMEAFLSDRESGGGHHRVEEVAEFLRRIPDASRNKVLIIGMTNRLEMIDPAILRRGRFDHVISVEFPNEEEVGALLAHLLATLPKDSSVDARVIAKALAGRPLSDVAFVVREGARLAARAGADMLKQDFLIAALETTPSRQDTESGRRIGFI
jgi:hypothetical protein